jgi:hypothetical protein
MFHRFKASKGSHGSVAMAMMVVTAMIVVTAMMVATAMMVVMASGLDLKSEELGESKLFCIIYY